MSNKSVVKNTAIFLCVGDKEIFGSYALTHLLDDYDLIVNYFGNNSTKIDLFKKHSTYFQHQPGTKFTSLKDIFSKHPNLSDRYKYVVCWDDDAIIKEGSISHLIDFMETYNLKIISPSHDTSAKISWSVMRTYPGNHVFRFTNFVEMTFPIFQSKFITQYLNEYDGSCCGHGNDWWYMNLIEDKGSKYDVGVCDGVIVTNPRNHSGKNNISEYCNKDNRSKQWEDAKNKYELSQWFPKTLAYVHKINNESILTPTTLMP
jgi:hypothetical protein